MVLTLVRDLEATRVVYYWIDKKSLERVSPLLSSLALATEWRLKFLHESHKGRDRRRSFIDRRRLTGKRDKQQQSFSSENSGRRAGDRPVRVEIDMAKVKLDELRLIYQEKLMSPSDIDPNVLFDNESNSGSAQ